MGGVRRSKSFASQRKYFRNPRGHRAAMAKGCRSKAIPPNDWDDIPFQREAYAPWRAIARMIRKGLPMEVVIHKAVRKWNLPVEIAQEMTHTIARIYK